MAVNDIYTLLTSQGWDHHWKFDEASGTLADSIGSLDMTASNVTYDSDELIASKSGDGSLLAASSASVATGASFSGDATNLCIQFFVKGDPMSSTLRNIFEIEDVCVVRMNSRQLRLGIGASESPNYSSTEGGWEQFEIQDDFNHHVIIRITGNFLEMMVDGQPYVTTMSASLSSSFTNKIVSCLYNSFYMQSVAVKLGTITDQQVTDLLRAGRGADATANLVVSNAGTTTAVGSEAAPLEINEAFRLSYMIGMGADLEVTAGEYALSGGITCRLKGKSGNLIRVVPKNGVGAEDCVFERKNISVTTTILSLQGEYYDFYSPQVKNADGLGRTDTDASYGILFTAKNVRLINPVIRDQPSNGIFKQGEATDSGLYETLLFNNGRWRGSSPVDPTGHNIYCQHYSSTNPFTIKNFVTWGSADFGAQIWGQSADLKGIDIENYIGMATGDWHEEGVFSAGLLIQSYKTISDIDVNNVDLYKVTASLGRSGDPHTDWTVDDLTCFESRVGVAGVSNLSMNNFHSISPPASHDWNDGTPSATGLTMTNSKYDAAGMSASTNIWNIDGSGNQNLSEWQTAQGTDAGAVLRDLTASAYSAPLIAYYPSDFITGNCIVRVYNPQDSNNVDIDLSETGLVDGQDYEIKDTQNYDTVLTSGTYDDASPTLSVAVNGTSVLSPVGYTIDGTASSRTNKRFKALKVIGGDVNDLAPTQPTDDDGTRNGNEGLDFTWTLNGAATTSVEFRFRQVGSETWVTDTLSAGAVSVSKTSLVTGGRYEFQIRGLNAAGSSEWTSLNSTVLTGVFYFGTEPEIEN